VHFATSVAHAILRRQPKPERTIVTQSALIIGASRGLGAGLVEAFAARGLAVTATVRDMATAPRAAARTLVCDIADDLSVAAFADALGADRFDVLFVNAGVYGPRDGTAASITHDEFAKLFWTNAVAPVRLVERIAGHAKPDGVIALMTSRMGSQALNAGGGDTYRASKAALNSFAISWTKRANPTQAVLLFHPGWVRTDMGGPNATLSVEESVAAMAGTVLRERGTPGCRFLDYAGATLAW
jgi:NAD(P)-dependent dehydrogenase (short-subunit alcohol dehydrogenase family)